jgi:hypothetical protein
MIGVVAKTGSLLCGVKNEFPRGLERVLFHFLSCQKGHVLEAVQSQALKAIFPLENCLPSKKPMAVSCQSSWWLAIATTVRISENSSWLKTS